MISRKFWSETASDATSAVATHAAVSGKAHYITDIVVSSDKANAVLLVKQGTTTLLQAVIGAEKEGISLSSPLKGEVGALVSAEIDGTADCRVNLIGFTE